MLTRQPCLHRYSLRLPGAPLILERRRLLNSVLEHGRGLSLQPISNRLSPQIKPALLACIGRELVRSGEVLFSIAVSRAVKSRFQSGWFMGRSRRSQIRRVGSTGRTTFGPSQVHGRGSHVRRFSSALPFLPIDPARPWAGISPLGYRAI